MLTFVCASSGLTREALTEIVGTDRSKQSSARTRAAQLIPAFRVEFTGDCIIQVTRLTISYTIAHASPHLCLLL